MMYSGNLSWLNENASQVRRWQHLSKTWRGMALAKKGVHWQTLAIATSREQPMRPRELLPRPTPKLRPCSPGAIWGWGKVRGWTSLLSVPRRCGADGRDTWQSSPAINAIRPGNESVDYGA